jgi:hypothetical protein
MKTNMILAAGIALAAIGAVTTANQNQPTQSSPSLVERLNKINADNERARQQDNKPSQHEVVVLHSSESGFGISDSNGYTYQYDGIKIYCSSSSRGAPQFPQMGIRSANNTTAVVGDLVPLAQAVADLLNDGYHIAHIPDNGYGGEYVLIK